MKLVNIQQPSEESLKALVSNFRSAMQMTLGSNLPLSQAREMVATMHGARNFKSLKTAFKRASHGSATYICVREVGGEQEIYTGQTQDEAFASLAINYSDWFLEAMTEFFEANPKIVRGAKGREFVNFLNLDWVREHHEQGELIATKFQNGFFRLGRSTRKNCYQEDPLVLKIIRENRLLRDEIGPDLDGWLQEASLSKMALLAQYFANPAIIVAAFIQAFPDESVTIEHQAH